MSSARLYRGVVNEIYEGNMVMKGIELEGNKVQYVSGFGIKGEDSIKCDFLF